MKREVVVCLCLLLTLVASAAFATTWYVATNGNDSTGNGSAGSPWATIDHADKSALLSPGDTVHVNPGTYRVNTSTTGYGVHITSASNGVTYQADSAGVAILQYGNSSMQGVVVQIDGNISTTTQTFTGFSVVGNQPANDLVVTNTTATVSHCIFNAPNSWIIVWINTVNGGAFENNVIVAGEMYLTDTRNAGSNPGVQVVNNTWTGSCGNTAAFYTGEWTQSPGPDVFENNIIGSGYWGGATSDSAAQTTVDYNDIYNAGGTNPSYSIYGGLASRAGTHNIFTNPLLLPNNRLATGSPCIDAGTYVGLPYNGNAPDIGAYEYRTPITYYVSATGSDTAGNGSSGSPWATIDHADKIGVLLPGDTVHVNAGTYAANTTITGYGVHITAASDGVTYQADSAGVTIQQCNNSAQQGIVVQIDGNFWTTSQTFTGFNVVGNEPANDLVVSNTIATVTNCTFNAPSSWIIVMIQTVNTGTFENNVIISGEMFLNDSRSYGYNPGFHIVNNTWAGSCNNTAAFNTGQWTDTPGPDVFENNIIGSGYWGGVTSDSAARTTVDFNDIYNDSGGNPSYEIWGGLASVAGPHNFSTDPKLLSNYHLGQDSPCIDAGTYVGLPYYGLAPDLGAFETTPAAGSLLTCYVSPSGNDTSPGSYGLPFASIDHARAFIAALPHPLTNPITVMIRAGKYFLTSPVVFSSGDSGTACCPVTYKAYNNENVEISGGYAGQRHVDFSGQRDLLYQPAQSQPKPRSRNRAVQAFVL